MSELNVLIKNVLDTMIINNPGLISTDSRNKFELLLSEELDSYFENKLTLSSSKPDYELILLSFVQKLQDDDTWRDIVHTGTGQTLLRNISAGIAFLNFSIIKASQNALLLPNSSKEVVYQHMNSKGVDIQRRIPKQITVGLSIPDTGNSFTIPRYSQFRINSEYYYNRDPIVFLENQINIATMLYQGVVYTRTGYAYGSPYEKIDVGYENYAISNDDVYVTVNGNKYTWLRDIKPWQVTPTQKIYFVKTLPNGNIELMFGNDIYGKQLNTNDEISITWTETLGLDANIVLTDSTFVNNDFDLTVNGVVLEGTNGGDNERPVDFYVNMGPHIQSSKLKAVKRSDYKALAIKYPGVRDALFRFQAELFPGKRSYMNMCEVTLLNATGTDSLFSDWNNFVKYLQNNGLPNMDYYNNPINIINIDISANIFCRANANLEFIRRILTKEIQRFNEPRLGSIGFSIFDSDMLNILSGKFTYNQEVLTDYIEYVEGFKFTYTYIPEVDVNTEIPNATDSDDSSNENNENEDDDTDSDENQYSDTDIPVIVDPSDPNDSNNPDPTPIPTPDPIQPEVPVVGINPAGDGVIADYTSYIKINNINLKINYTPRKIYRGRSDLPPNV